jgi:hypothetical protein
VVQILTSLPLRYVFTDEAQIKRDGILDFHNQHLWAEQNLHALLISQHQQHFSINIWAGICGLIYSEPMYFQNRFTGLNYKALLVNNMPDLLANVPLIIHQELYFMHNDPPAHFSFIVCRNLNQEFPVG